MPRALAMPDAPFERAHAGEPAIDHEAEHGEDHDPGNPASGDIVERVGNEDAAGHGADEQKENHEDGRAMFVFDAHIAERAQALLIAAQGMRANRSFHFFLPDSSEVCRSANLNSPGDW
jgi:uncharacterized sporulation protein YeaH/YhbH (DUF444 family)